MSRKRNLRNENRTRNKNENKKIKKKNKKTSTVNTMEGWPPTAGSGSAVTNRHASDNGAKLIFKDPVLCAEFLRGYTDIPLLKNVQPEDIEDVSERFLPMFQEGRDSDSVKKVRLKGLKRDEMEMYLIAIVEHPSKIDYGISFRLLRYVVMMLTDYESELERLYPGITKTKDFKYPPILPVVYYEGTENWSAVKDFHDKVYLSDMLGEYIPKFQYMVVPLHDYSDTDLMKKGDELSLLMLINKLQNSSEFKKLKDIPADYLKNLNEKTPEYLLHLIGKIIATLLYKLNVPRGEVEEFTDKIERREFDMLFDSFEAYDVQETRRISREEGRKEGREEGRKENLIDLICKKMKRGYGVAEIADMLEEEVTTVREICDVVNEMGSDSDPGAILKRLNEKESVPQNQPA